MYEASRKLQHSSLGSAPSCLVRQEAESDPDAWLEGTPSSLCRTSPLAPRPQGALPIVLPIYLRVGGTGREDEMKGERRKG